MRLVGEEQVAVLLVGVRLLRAFLDADHSAPHRARVLAERSLEREVALRARSDVLLERVVVEVLTAVGEVRARDARGGSGAGQVVLDPHLAALRAEAPDHPVELRIALEPRLVPAEMPGLTREVLERDVFDLRALAQRRDHRELVGDRGRQVDQHQLALEQRLDERLERAHAQRRDRSHAAEVHHHLVRARGFDDVLAVELLVDDIPFPLLADLLEAVDHFGFLIVLDRGHLSMIVVLVAHEDDLGLDAGGTAKSLDGVRVKGDVLAFAGCQIEERLAVPAQHDRLRFIGRVGG